MKKPTLEEYIEALKKISKNPNDSVKIGAASGLVVVGGVAGASSAGVFASAAGATTILGNAALGSAFTSMGLGALAVTPVGWTIGIGAAGVLATAGLLHLYKSRLNSEEIIKQTTESLKKKINDLENEALEVDDYSEKLGKVAGLYALIFQMGLIPEQETIELVFEGIVNGEINIDEAFDYARALLKNRSITVDIDSNKILEIAN